MSANQILMMQENANGDYAIKTLIPEAGKVVGFDSNLNPIMVDAGSGGGGTSTIFHSQTDLNIDGNNGNFFSVSLSANTSFILSNIEVGVMYYFRIYNSNSSNITVSFPNTSDIRPSSIGAYVSINTFKYTTIAMNYNGTVREWQVAEEGYLSV